MKPFNPDSHMDSYMSGGKHLIQFANELGRMSASIENLTGSVDKMADRMMTRDSVEIMISSAIAGHKDTYHKRSSLAPVAMSVRQKSTLIGAIVTALTAIAAFFAQRFGG